VDAGLRGLPGGPEPGELVRQQPDALHESGSGRVLHAPEGEEPPAEPRGKESAEPRVKESVEPRVKESVEPRVKESVEPGSKGPSPCPQVVGVSSVSGSGLDELFVQVEDAAQEYER